MIRLAYISLDPGVPVFGRKGCSVHVQEMLRALVKRGAQIELFAVSRGGEVPAGLKAVRCHDLPPAPKGPLSVREQRCLAANETVRSMLESAGPFDLVYERYSLWSYSAMEYAQREHIPGLLEVNAPLIEEQSEYRGLVDRPGAEEVARRVFASASGLLAVSDEVAAYLRSFKGTSDKVHVVPNAIDPERFPAGIKPALPISPGTFTVGFVGSMKQWHGLSDLLRAFGNLQKHSLKNRLLMVGDGPVRPELEAQAKEMDLLSSIHFTGAVPPAEIPGLLASMDLGVAPYQRVANFYFSPLKVFEYMAAGLPVVASEIGQLTQIIEPEVTGLLVPPGNVDGLTNAMLRMRNEPALRFRIGQQARAKVFRHHTWEANACRILGPPGFALKEPLHPA